MGPPVIICFANVDFAIPVDFFECRGRDIILCRCANTDRQRFSGHQPRRRDDLFFIDILPLCMKQVTGGADLQAARAVFGGGPFPSEVESWKSCRGFLSPYFKTPGGRNTESEKNCCLPMERRDRAFFASMT